MAAAADPQESWSSGWEVVLDNDALISPEYDRDYTGGVALDLSGSRAASWWFSLDPLLSGVNRLTRLNSLFDDGLTGHAMQFGILWTKNNHFGIIASRQALHNDSGNSGRP